MYLFSAIAEPVGYKSVAKIESFKWQLLSKW